MAVLLRASGVLFPEQPVEGYLGAQDGENEGEEPAAEVVAPGGVDHQRGGDGERDQNEKEGDAEQNAPRRPQEAARPVVAGPEICRVGVCRVGVQRQSLLFAAFFSAVELSGFFAPFGPDFASEEPVSSEPPLFVSSFSVFLLPL